MARHTMQSSTVHNLTEPRFRGPNRSSISATDDRVKTSQQTNSLERALAILELVAYKSGGLSNGEICACLKIPTSTASYILSRLEREGFLRREPETGRYEIGLKIVALSHGAFRDMGLRRIAEPILHKMAAETKVSGFIGVLERGRVMIVDKVEKPDLAKIDMDIGVRYPAHSTALGKSMLAHLPKESLLELFEQYGLQKSSPRTIDSKSQLLEELEIVRKQGYSTSDGELYLGFRAVAAPIFGASGEARAAVSATGVTVLVDDSKVIDAVRTAAHEISLRVAASEMDRAPRR
jgi:IclR family transcriptional regulator, KDG regulon repressor